MRIDVDGSWFHSLEERIRIYEKAKELIEEKGKRHYVLELRQVTCMGGIRCVVTSIKGLDESYIGYKGYYSYRKLCERLEKCKAERNKPRPKLY